LQVTLYPNPNNGSFNLGINGVNLNDATANVYVYDLMGQMVLNEQIPISNGQYNGTINMGASITNGLYMYMVKTGDQELRGKFVVTKY